MSRRALGVVKGTSWMEMKSVVACIGAALAAEAAGSVCGVQEPHCKQHGPAKGWVFSAGSVSSHLREQRENSLLVNGRSEIFLSTLKPTG